MTVAASPALLAGRSHKLGKDDLLWIVPPLSVLIGMTALAGVDPTSVGPYGLVDTYPPAAFFALLLLGVGFVITLYRSPQRSALLVLYIIGLIVLLDGAASISEGEARLGTSWLHAGFIDQITTTGQVLRHTDARWSWPSFFAAVAQILEPAGMHSARPLLLWAPVILDLMFLGPLVMLAKALAPTARACWFAVWLFFLTDWVGQNYFSPQGLNFFLLLVLLALVVTYLKRPGPLPRRLERWRGPARRPPRMVDLPPDPSDTSIAPPLATRNEISVIVVLTVVTGFGMIVSHQLTPVALIIDLFALAFFRRLSHPWLAVLLCVALLAYINFVAADYWQGHFADLTGFGSKDSGVSQGVNKRVAGDPAHLRVVYIRFMLTGGMFGLAALGGLLAAVRRNGRLVPAMLLAAAPLPIPVVQAYGGEGVLRAYLYALPFASILAAALVFGRPKTGPPRASAFAHVVALGLTLVLGAAYLISRYGNEAFEQMRPGEVSAVEYMYKVAPKNSSLIALFDNLPWRYQGLASYNYDTVSGAMTVANVRKTLVEAPGPAVYLIVTTGQEQYGRLNDGEPAGWSTKIVTGLRRTGAVKVVYSDKDAIVMRRVAAPPVKRATTGTAGRTTRTATPAARRAGTAGTGTRRTTGTTGTTRRTGQVPATGGQVNAGTGRQAGPATVVQGAR